MASFSKKIILRNFRELIIFKSGFSSSPIFSNKWRISQNLEPNPSSFSPLTNLPDYSYLDGRLVPLSKTRRNKIKLQQQYCKIIERLCYEMDEAEKCHKEKLIADEEAKNKFLSSKFKPKGKALKLSES